jgi:N-acetylglucosamine-6-phosphate deacetylase
MVIQGRDYRSGEAIEIDVRQGRIAKIRALAGRDDAAARVPLPWVAPGLVDVQINGYGGQEFSSLKLTPERVAEIVRRHDRLGVTQLCPTVTTEGFETLAHAMRTINATCRRWPQIERRIPGIHLEGPYISPHDGPRGAHPLPHCRPPDWDEFQRLQEAAGGRIRIVTLSPEYAEAERFIARAAASGVLVAIGHTSADSDQIRAAVDAGARLSTHLGNGAHRELRRHPNYLWDQLAEDRLTASLIADGHHLPAEVVKTFVRAKTPERCILVSDESGLAGLPPGRYTSNLCDVEILDDGRLVIAGQRQLLAGASRPLCDGIVNVMRFAGVDLATAIEMAVMRPARMIGCDHQGLAEGQRADLVLFQLDADASGHPTAVRIEQTIVAGETIFSAAD